MFICPQMTWSDGLLGPSCWLDDNIFERFFKMTTSNK